MLMATSPILAAGQLTSACRPLAILQEWSQSLQQLGPDLQDSDGLKNAQRLVPSLQAQGLTKLARRVNERGAPALLELSPQSRLAIFSDIATTLSPHHQLDLRNESTRINNARGIKRPISLLSFGLLAKDSSPEAISILDYHFPYGHGIGLMLEPAFGGAQETGHQLYYAADTQLDPEGYGVPRGFTALDGTNALEIGGLRVIGLDKALHKNPPRSQTPVDIVITSSLLKEHDDWSLRVIEALSPTLFLHHTREDTVHAIHHETRILGLGPAMYRYAHIVFNPHSPDGPLQVAIHATESGEELYGYY